MRTSEYSSPMAQRPWKRASSGPMYWHRRDTPRRNFKDLRTSHSGGHVIEFTRLPCWCWTLPTLQYSTTTRSSWKGWCDSSQRAGIWSMLRKTWRGARTLRGWRCWCRWTSRTANRRPKDGTRRDRGTQSSVNYLSKKSFGGRRFTAQHWLGWHMAEEARWRPRRNNLLSDIFEMDWKRWTKRRRKESTFREMEKWRKTTRQEEKRGKEDALQNEKNSIRWGDKEDKAGKAKAEEERKEKAKASLKSVMAGTMEMDPVQICHQGRNVSLESNGNTSAQYVVPLVTHQRTAPRKARHEIQGEVDLRWRHVPWCGERWRRGRRR